LHNPDPISSFILEPSPWGISFAIGLTEWERMGLIDPITGIPIQQIRIDPGTGELVDLFPRKLVTNPLQVVILAPRRGPEEETHFWYGKTPSGANIKVFPSA